MARLYDIAQRMAAGKQKPTVRFDEEHEYVINTSKSAVLMVNAISDDEGKNEIEKMDAVVAITLGKEAAEYIDSLDLPITALVTVMNTIMAAVSDVTLEEMEEMSKGEAKQPGKKRK